MPGRRPSRNLIPAPDGSLALELQEQKEPKVDNELREEERAKRHKLRSGKPLDLELTNRRSALRHILLVFRCHLGKPLLKLTTARRPCRERLGSFYAE